MRKSESEKTSRGVTRRVLPLLLLVVVMAAGMAVAIRMGLAGDHAARMRADFSGLVDTSGRAVEAAGISGRYKLVAYGYTSCPDACPATLTKMHGVLEALHADQAGLVPIFITLDPAHDTADVLAAYVQHFDSRIIGLTGEAPSLNASAARLGALPSDNAAMRTADGGPNHAVRLYLLAPDDTLLQSYELTDATSLVATDVVRRLSLKS